MKCLIPVPSKGTPLRASWGAAVANGMNALASMSAPGMMSREGITGTGYQPFPTNRRDRKSPSDLYPWKVFAKTQSEDVDHCFEIYIPNGVVHVGEVDLDIEGVTEVPDSDGRYTIDCEIEIEGNGSFILAIFREAEEEQEGVYSSENEDMPWTAKIISDVEEIEDTSEVLVILPIANVSISTDGEYPSGSVTRQLVRSAVSFPESQTNIDDVSVGKVTDDDAEDPSAIQIKDFDNDESDGNQGLAERLELVKIGSGEEATYKIKAKGTNSTVHILARVNGKIKYIPLSGEDEQDEDEKNGSGKDPCDHPGGGTGSGGGVPVDDDDEEHGMSGGAGGGAGGVEAEDGTSHGNPCTSENCNT